MRKKEVEKYIKKATENHITTQLSDEASERVWENIKDVEPASNIQPEKKKPIIRYSAVSCAAVFVIILVSVLVLKQFNSGNSVPIIDGTVTNYNTSVTETSAVSPPISMQGEEAVPPAEINKQDGALNEPTADFLPDNIVLGNRAYQYKNDIKVNEKDIDREYIEKINGQTVTVYSLKGKTIESACALKINNMYFYYECI